ncbi:MAG TPA: hypothetical protein VHZ51_23165 [Ktedonobacteraceae bacterium]|jgi:hypothetical protein|nr:hypothetical protein [Ktedonobacteraceae bacterium]
MNAGTLVVGAAVVIACGVILFNDKRYGVIACVVVLALALIATLLLTR